MFQSLIKNLGNNRDQRKRIEESQHQQKLKEASERSVRESNERAARAGIPLCRIDECLEKLDLISASDIALNLRRGLSAILDFSKFRECNNCLPKTATLVNVKSMPKDYIQVTIDYGDFKELYNASSLGVKDVIVELKNKIKNYVNKTSIK